MRFEITGAWQTGYENDGLLFCAQKIEEMMMKYTSHLYRVPVYNSLLLVTEYSEIYALVQRGIVDQSHLNNILDEFIDTFSADVVIRDHYSDSEIQLFISKLKGNSRPEQKKMMNYLFHVLSDYPNWCIASLKDSVNNPKEKKRIERILRSYLPMIVGLGYSSEYIYKHSKSIFLDPTICDSNAINWFLNRFNMGETDYTVYFAVDKKVIKFKSILESRLSVSFAQDEFSKKLKYDTGRMICVNLKVSALDPYMAAIAAYHQFNIFIRYYRFLGNRYEEICGSTALVRDAEGVVDFPPLRPDRYVISKDFDDRTLAISSERIINKLLENSAGNDLIKVTKIIQTHNTALSCRDPSNAFLNLWSILEIVGVYDRTDTKIKEIMRSIIPILKRNYIKLIVEELHDYLKANLTEQEYNMLLNDVDKEGTEEERIAYLVILRENEDKRRKAYGYLKSYPVIRSRISQLHEDVFKDKKKYSTELARYEQRLTWHIQRLYRVRNSIIHSGDTDNNIRILVEHLHSYVDEIILEILDRLCQDNSLGSISNVIIDAQVFLENLDKELKKNEAFTKKDIQKMLS